LPDCLFRPQPAIEASRRGKAWAATGAFQVAATRLIRHPKTVAMLVPVNLVSLHFLNRQDRKDG
jgi:hypothetical protein